MYNNSAYWKNSRIDVKDKKHPLFVTSCGNYKLLTKEILPTHRPRGRLDYQILYIAAGKGEFYFQGRKTYVTAGHIVIYHPKEEQKYYYYLKDNPEVYWVHFTGSDVKNILRQYHILEKDHVIYVGMTHYFKYVFNMMISELLLCKDNYEEMLVYMLRQIFILINRGVSNPVTAKQSQISNQIEGSVRYFNEHFNEVTNIEEYARSLGLSTCWFIRKFKEHMGTTPMSYILDIRLRTAQLMLENSDDNISEISRTIGYDNPLYFSRIFKQRIGMSPSEFRKKHKGEWN